MLVTFVHAPLDYSYTEVQVALIFSVEEKFELAKSIKIAIPQLMKVT